MLAERVTQRRAELGISQAELARRVGVTAQAIQSLESGRTRTFRAIMQLAKALEVNVGYFTTPDDALADTTLTTEDYLAEFGRRVSATRRRLGLDPEEAARRIMPAARWLDMEEGAYWPNPVEFDLVCRVLDETADYLARGLTGGPKAGELRSESMTVHESHRRFLPYTFDE